MLTKIKPLIVGIGVAGRRHLEAQLNLGIKTGIYTTNPQTAKSLRNQNNVIVFNNLENGIDWANLVHICTPDDKHTEFVAKALKKGRVVLCEKSFTTSLKDALYLQDLSYRYNGNVFVGQNYRLTPTFAEIRKRVLKGQLGVLSSIETTYFHDKADFERRYSDRYFLYSGGSHAVDLACWIAGEQIVSIKASSQNKLNYQITVIFSSGLKGDIILDASLPRTVSGTDLIVYGEKGKFVSHNKSDKLLFYKKIGKNPQSILLPNNKTLTVPLEIKIIDDYLLGKTSTYWPLLAMEEAVSLIKVLSTIKKAIFLGKTVKI